MISDDIGKALMHGALYNEDDDSTNAMEVIRNHARVVAAYYGELVKNGVPENFAFPMTMALFSAGYARQVNHGQ
jgi:TRAP-type uncharacterized transport system substrate-binding protein